MTRTLIILLAIAFGFMPVMMDGRLAGASSQDGARGASCCCASATSIAEVGSNDPACPLCVSAAPGPNPARLPSPESCGCACLGCTCAAHRPSDEHPLPAQTSPRVDLRVLLPRSDAMTGWVMEVTPARERTVPPCGLRPGAMPILRAQLGAWLT